MLYSTRLHETLTIGLGKSAISAALSPVSVLETLVVRSGEGGGTEAFDRGFLPDPWRKY